MSTRKVNTEKEKDGKEMELWLDVVSYICCRTAWEGVSIDGAMTLFNGVIVRFLILEIGPNEFTLYLARLSLYQGEGKVTN